MVARLITENDVREGRIPDPLVVDRDTIITPSALDALYAQGIRVVYARDLAVSARTGSAAASIQDPQRVPLEAKRAVSSEPTAASPSSNDPPPSCGCAKGPSETARSPATARSPDPSPVPRAASGDWVEIYRKGRPRRFDATPFRPARASSHDRVEVSGIAVGREVLVSGVGAGNASAFVLAVESLGHRVLRFSQRTAGERIHLLAAIELGSGENSLDATFRAIESQECGFELRCHPSL